MKHPVLNFLITILFCSCFHIEGYAQGEASSTLEETGLWNGLYIKAKLRKNIGYYGEHHYRLRNSRNDVNSFVGRNRQIYNRAGINIFFSKYFELVFGPTLVLNFTPEPGNDDYEHITLEPRIWHQWMFIMPKMGRVKLYHQFRFEHRWKRDNGIHDEYKYTDRYRYKFFAYIPLNKKDIEKKTLFFSPSAEIFMHSGKSIVFNPFEDFRTYNGLGYVLNANITLFAGNMWTFGQKSVGYEYKTTHIIRVNVMVGLDLRNIENKLPPINIGY